MPVQSRRGNRLLTGSVATEKLGVNSKLAAVVAAYGAGWTPPPAD